MRYRLTIGINTYYLSEEDKNYYLEAINHGSQFVQLKNGLILSRQFMDISPLSEIEKTKDIELKLEEGRWECSHGKWHYNGSDCHCQTTPLIEPAEYSDEPAWEYEYAPRKSDLPKKVMTKEQEIERKQVLMKQAQELEKRGL